MQLRLGSLSRWYLRHFAISQYGRRKIVIVRTLSLLGIILAFGIHFFGPGTTPFGFPSYANIAQGLPTSGITSLVAWSVIFVSLWISALFHLRRQTYSCVPMNQGLSFFPLMTYLIMGLWAVSWGLEGDAMGVGSRGVLGTVLRWMGSVTVVLTHIRLAKGFAPAVTWKDAMLINFPYSLFHVGVLASTFNHLLTPIGPLATLEALQGQSATTPIIQGFSITGSVCLACLVLIFTCVSRDAIFGISWGFWNLVQSQKVYEIREFLEPQVRQGLLDGYTQLIVTFGVSGCVLIVAGFGIAALNAYEGKIGRRLNWRERATAEKLR